MVLTNIDIENTQHSLLLVIFFLLVFIFASGIETGTLPQIPFTGQ